jgi:hypothetical protein
MAHSASAPARSSVTNRRTWSKNTVAKVLAGVACPAVAAGTSSRETSPATFAPPAMLPFSLDVYVRSPPIFAESINVRPGCTLGMETGEPDTNVGGVATPTSPMSAFTLPPDSPPRSGPSPHQLCTDFSSPNLMCRDRLVPRAGGRLRP